MSDPTVKFCLEHPQKWLQIFQVSGKAGRFGLVKPGHPSKYSLMCLFSGDTLKIVIDSAKKKIQTFFYIEIFRGVLWTTFYTNSPWWMDFQLEQFQLWHVCINKSYLLFLGKMNEKTALLLNNVALLFCHKNEMQAERTNFLFSISSIMFA